MTDNRRDRRNPRQAPLVALALTLALAAAAPVAAADTTSEWIDGLEGGWYGEENDTPMGRMGFGLLFERQEDGSLRAFSAANRESWIELHFFRGEDGRWMLKEGAALEGVGERGSVLEPVAPEGALRRWVSPEDPEYLAIDVSRSADTLFVHVLVHGREHATFHLQRLEGERLAALRNDIRRSAQLDPAEASIYAGIGNGEVPPAILRARAGVATYPDDAGRHLELAEAIGAAIDTDPMAAPRYAMEMLRSLQRARELDPDRPEVYEWLVGYYLEAPPIAGGSIEKARALAMELSALDAERGRALLAKIEDRARTGDGGR